MPQYYKLVDKKPVPITDVREWAEAIDGEKARVALDTYGEIKVSTVFLGLNCNLEEGEPLLFETMIFGGEHDDYQTRCSTWDEAVQQHKDACEIVNNGVMSWIKRKLNL